MHWRGGQILSKSRSIFLTVTDSWGGLILPWFPRLLGISWPEDDAEPGAVILARVVTGSPAPNAGLRAGDRIYQVATQDFADGDAFIRLVGNVSDTLQLLMERDGQLRTVVVYFHSDLQKRAA